jgi:hypothetical protein
LCKLMERGIEKKVFPGVCIVVSTRTAYLPFRM